MVKKVSSISLCLISLSAAVPPGGPIGEFGPAKMAGGAYFDHSGQSLFEDRMMTSSVLNSAGIQVLYAPFRFIQGGVYLGGAEFDHHPPKNQPDGFGFNSDYTFNAGLTGELFTRRFLNDRVCGFGFGSAGYLKAEDGHQNVRQILELHSGVGLQYKLNKFFNLGAGVEFFRLAGQQGNDTARAGNNPFGNRDLFRSLFSLECYPPANRDLMKSQPFISLSLRVTGATGWDEELGLKNASLSISAGIITDFLYGRNKEAGEEPDY